MPSIAVAVGDVVHEVDDAGQHAEHRQRRHGVADGGGVKEALAEQQAREDDEVLDPLGRAQGMERVEGKRALRDCGIRSTGRRHGG
jgi:hypothetical protein